MIGNEHTSKIFDSELEAVRARVLQMGGLVEKQIRRAIEALVSRDEILMGIVVADDHSVNGLEVEIDESCNNIIACRQPVLTIDGMGSFICYKINSELPCLQLQNFAKN